MAHIEMDVDDALLGEAARALGTHGAEDTVRAALQAAARRDNYIPGGVPRYEPPLGSPRPPDRPTPAPDGRPPEFPRPPEIH